MLSVHPAEHPCTSMRYLTIINLPYLDMNIIIKVLDEYVCTGLHWHAIDSQSETDN